jgi:hypothetical protein
MASQRSIFERKQENRAVMEDIFSKLSVRTYYKQDQLKVAVMELLWLRSGKLLLLEANI